MKLKSALIALTALGSLAAAGAASALPSATPNALGGTDTVIQVKGGHGHGWGHRGGRGHHYGWGRGHHYGWGHHRH
ncbi:Spy/CpxP family protein refolding chaperone [Bradyrhizobium sp. i1.8.4]